jgi:RNA polymerase sigma factor (sigma-70 family)
MEISEKQLDEVMRIVRWKLRNFQTRNDWDDILGIAYMGMWTGIQRCRDNPRFNLKSIGVQSAVWDVLTYVRKAKRIRDTEWSLEFETASEDGEDSTIEYLTQPDFAPSVDDQIAVEELLRNLGEREREILVQYHLEGMTFDEIAAAHGKKSRTWAFNHVRAAEKKLRAGSLETSSGCRS